MVEDREDGECKFLKQQDNQNFISRSISESWRWVRERMRAGKAVKE